jgi:hypothetical protein
MDTQIDTTHKMAKAKGRNNERTRLKLKQSKALKKINLAGLTH